MGSTGASRPARCDSCGAPGTLGAVRRVYLHADGAGEVTGSTTMPEVEWWCASCRALYPSEPGPPDEPVPG